MSTLFRLAIPSQPVLRCLGAALLAMLPACQAATTTSGPAVGSPPPPLPEVGRTPAAPPAADPRLAEYLRRMKPRPAAPEAGAEVQWTRSAPTTPTAAVSAEAREAAAVASQARLRRPVETAVAPAPTPPAPPAAAAVDPVISPPPAPAAAAPTQPAEPSRIELIDQLAGKIRRDARGREDLRRYLSEAALSVFDPSRRLNAQDLEKLGEADRSLVLSYQDAFRQLALSLEDDRGEQRRHLQDAARRLAEEIAPKPGLRIAKTQLCTQVRGFGVFKKFASNSFLAGRRQPIIVYTELEDFTSQVDSKDEHVVRLKQEIVLYNESDGLAVWRIKPSEIVDRSRTRRRDFFVVNKTFLPDRLTVGKYRLKVTMTDTQGLSVDEATLPIRVVADPTLVQSK